MMKFSAHTSRPPGPSAPPGTGTSMLAPLSTGWLHLRTTWFRPRSSSYSVRCFCASDAASPVGSCAHAGRRHDVKQGEAVRYARCEILASWHHREYALCAWCRGWHGASLQLTDCFSVPEAWQPMQRTWSASA